MVEHVAGSRALPINVLQQIVNKTDGVPLFVEELTKSVIESVEGQGHALLQTIPATLHDSPMARLDRLATAKEVAQLASVLGREFSYELLQAVSLLDERSLHQGLRQLVETELVYQRGLPPQATYTFKHALIQDTAYQSLLKSRRQQLHQQIAQVLTERFPMTQEAQPELLAYHYTEAGLVAQAIPQWQRAGQRAIQHSANVEAITHLTKGLELIQNLPDTVERAQQELRMHIALGSSLIVTKGYTAPEVEQVYQKARALCQQIPETPQFFLVLIGLWSFYFIRAEFKTAYELAEECLSLAQGAQDPARLLTAHTLLGQVLSMTGELVLSRQHFDQGIALY